MSIKKIGSLSVAAFVMLVGFTVMIGWLLKSDVIIRVIPGFESMKWNTALGFLVAGASFFALLMEEWKWSKQLKTFFAGFTILIGLTSVIQYYLHINLGVDELFVDDYGARLKGHSYPGRMAISTGLSFLLVGLAFLVLKSRHYAFRFIAQTFLHLVSAISLVAILGYAYSVPSLHKLSFLVSMALHTSVCFFLLTLVASLSNHTIGLSGLFAGKGVGSLMARKLFPFLAGSLVFLGAVGIWAFRNKYLAVDFGIAIFVLLFLFIGLFLIWNTAKSLNVLDVKRRKAEASIIALNRELEAKVNKRTEALRVATKRLKLATSSTGIGIWEYFVDDNMVKLDDTLESLFGIAEEDSNYTLQSFLELLHEDDREQVESSITKASKEKDELNLAFRVIDADKEVKYLSFRAVVMGESQNEAFKLIGTIWDVTEQKVAELELRLSNERNKIFVAQAPNALAMFDKNMNYMAASAQWYSDYGINSRDVIGISHYEVFPEIGEEWKQIHRECLTGAVNRNEEALFERADGTRQYLKWDVRPWYLTDTEIGGILMYTEDITHLKEAEKEQRKIEEILATTSDIARIGTWEVDMTCQKVTWSDITKEIHGVDLDFEPQLAEGINFYKEGESRNEISQLVKESIEEGTPYDVELQIVTAQGYPKWVRVIGQSEMSRGKCVRIFGVFQDIDKKKKTQQELHQVNQELKAILDSGTHVSIISTDLDGTITHFSKGAETLLGYKAEELEDKATPGVLHLQEEVEERGEELTQKYGREIRGFDVFTEYAKQGKFENRQWTYVRKDGSKFPVQLVVTGIKSEKGELTGFLGIASDISEIKEKEARINEANTELEILTTRLKGQNNQLANFAHITSHNLRSPVSNLLMLLNMYNDVNNNPDQKEVVLEKFEIVIHHLSETLNDLMAALKIQEDVNKERDWVYFQQVVDKTISLLEGDIISTDAEIECDFSEAKKVYYNRGYLESIMLNIISNALKYRSPDRAPRIKLTSTNINGSIWLKIADNGLGINMERHGKKLFGLHKTFHRHKDAKGVGLYLTKTQIETMGGSISATSEVNKGTEFSINFNKSV